MNLDDWKSSPGASPERDHMTVPVDERIDTPVVEVLVPPDQLESDVTIRKL